MNKKITLTKLSDNTQVVYSSWNEACRANGATSGKSEKSSIAFLAKCGFDMTSYGIEKSENGSASASKATSEAERVIALFEKKLSVIDKEAIKQAKAKLNELTMALVMGSDLTPIIELKTRILALENPQTTLEAMHTQLDLWYETCMQERAKAKAEADTQAQAQE